MSYQLSFQTLQVFYVLLALLQAFQQLFFGQRATIGYLNDVEQTELRHIHAISYQFNLP